jgi:parallel beta-helix repeat protein
LRGISINAVGVNNIYCDGIKAHHNYVNNGKGDGIYFIKADKSDVSDNYITDSGWTDGIILEADRFGKVMNNTVIHPVNRGIYLGSGSDNCIVSGNTIVMNKKDNGILVSACRHVIVSNNTIKNELGNWAGITLDPGVYVWHDTYHLVSGNVIDNCNPAIRVSTDFNTISNTKAFGGTYGIAVDGGNYNTIRDNDIDSPGSGVSLQGIDGRKNPNGTRVLNNYLTGRIFDNGANSTKSGNIFSTGPVSGKATLLAGTVTINTAEVQTGDNIILSRSIAGGGVGHLSVGTIAAGISFVINSSSTTDTSTIFWEIRH